MGKPEKRGISRRGFIQSAVTGAAGAAALGVFGASTLAGCSKPDESGKRTASSALAANDSIEVIDCDVLIIGAGLNGTYAANQVLEEGGRVTFVEKGPWRHGGVAGMNVDLFNVVNTIAPNPDNLVYMPYATKAHEMFARDDETFWTYMVNHGQVIPTRNPDGSVEGFGSPEASQGYFFRKQQDVLDSKDKVSVYDRTMITDILVNDGICRGAIGLHLPTGTLRVFRAKATIADTGGCTWIYGWFTVAAHTANGLENTADVDMAAWRRGCGIGESEFSGFDTIGVYPRGLAMAGGALIDAEPDDARAVCDKNGEYIFTDDAIEGANNRVLFNQTIARLVHEEGRGTENDGILVKMGEVKYTRRMYERNIPLMKKFGIDTDTFEMEMLPDMYDHGGQPIVDDTAMTEIPGLFHGRGAGGVGIDGGALVSGNMVYGRYAGHCALEYARTADEPTGFDLAPAHEEYERLRNILTHTSEDPVTPYEVRTAIQKAGEKALGIYRTTEMMNEALSELSEIRNNLITRMVVRDSSLTFNMDWKQAIEAFNMLDCCEMSVRASLTREEARGYYVRPDFPEIDDENWRCMLVCYNRSGQMEFEKRALDE